MLDVWTEPGHLLPETFFIGGPIGDRIPILATLLMLTFADDCCSTAFEPKHEF